MAENQETRAGHEEVERFAGQLRKFGGSRRCARGARTIGRLVRGAALFGAALLLLTACGGNEGSGEGSGDGRGSEGAGSNDYNANATLSQGSQASAEQKVLSDASSVDDLLNEFWKRELDERYELAFDPPDRFEYYNTTGNAPCGGEVYPGQENAYYCFVDEYVAFDLDWLSSYLSDHPGGATTFLVLAHEWGHAVQDTWEEKEPGKDAWNPPYRKELNADCLAGVWMADALRQGDVIEESGDAEAIFGWLWETGSGQWLDPGDHGTKEQRQLAFSDGFEQGTDFCRTQY